MSVERNGALETVSERAAKNQAVFRDANERIEAAAEALTTLDSAPFICECPEQDCTALVQLPLTEYELIRQHGERFLVAPGHEVTHVDGVEVARVVEKREGYSLMDKVGEAGEVARELDPRATGRRSDGRAHAARRAERGALPARQRGARGAREAPSPGSRTTRSTSSANAATCVCNERIAVDVGAYEKVRADPTLFFVLPGHELPDVEHVVEVATATASCASIRVSRRACGRSHGHTLVTRLRPAPRDRARIGAVTYEEAQDSLLAIARRNDGLITAADVESDETLASDRDTVSAAARAFAGLDERVRRPPRGRRLVPVQRDLDHRPLGRPAAALGAQAGAHRADNSCRARSTRRSSPTGRPSRPLAGVPAPRCRRAGAAIPAPRSGSWRRNSSSRW